MKLHTNVDTRVPFVGRRDELVAIARSLEERRAVVLAGAPGTGTSRLALEAALRHPAGAGGVGWITLAGVAPESVNALLSQAFEPRARNFDLLVLDGCERAPEAVDKFVRDTVLHSQAAVLATSRVTIASSHLAELGVDALSGPDAAAFVRARAGIDGIALDETPATTSAVECVAERAGRLPAALDVTVPLLRSLAPQELADRLEPLDGYAAILHFCIEMLDPAVRYALLSASAYAGDFSPDDILALGARGSARNAAAALRELLDRSLLVPGEDVRTYRMPRPIREVARALYGSLAQNDRTAIEKNFASRVNAIGRRLAEQVQTAGQQVAMRTIAARYGDLTAALAWALDEPHARLPSTIDVMPALISLWADAGRFDEGMPWCDRVVDACPALEPRRRATTYYQCIRVAHAACNYDRIFELARAAISMFTITSDRIGLARSYNALSVASLYTGRVDLAQAHAETALRFYESENYQRGVAATLINLGNVELEGRRDPPAARALYERALAPLIGRGGFDPLTALLYGNLAEAEYCLKDADAMERNVHIALSHIARTGDEPRRGWQLTLLARAKLLRGDAAGAAKELLVALDALQRGRHPDYCGLCFETAVACGAEFAPQEALTIALATQRFRREERVVPVGPARDDAGAVLDRLREAATQEDARRAESEAATLDASDLFERCRAMLLAAIPRTHPAGKVSAT